MRPGIMRYMFKVIDSPTSTGILRWLMWHEYVKLNQLLKIIVL
jgi:hypothetical protein